MHILLYIILLLLFYNKYNFNHLCLCLPYKCIWSYIWEYVFMYVHSIHYFVWQVSAGGVLCSNSK